MFKGVAGELIVHAFNRVGPVTGDAANITASVRIDDGALVALTTNVASEIDADLARGFYWLPLTADETNGDRLLFAAESTTDGVVVLAQPPAVTTLPLPATLRASVREALGVAIPNLDAQLAALANIAGAAAAIAGAGPIAVDHNYGGTNQLAYTSHGIGVAGAEILAYLTTDWEAGRRELGYRVGSSFTAAGGRWSHPLLLAPGQYTLIFFRQGQFGPDLVSLRVTG